MLRYNVVHCLSHHFQITTYSFFTSEAIKSQEKQDELYRNNKFGKNRNASVVCACDRTKLYGIFWFYYEPSLLIIEVSSANKILSATVINFHHLATTTKPNSHVIVYSITPCRLHISVKLSPKIVSLIYQNCLAILKATNHCSTF